MSENIVYEMTQMIKDKAAVQKDMSNALNLVQKMFRDKYISKINDVVQTHQVKAKSNPPKEVVLLHALKPYIAQEQHANIDKLVESFIMLNTLQNIRSDMVNSSISSSDSVSVTPEKIVKASSICNDDQIDDPSVHSDGIYDMDMACLVNKRQNDFALPGGQLAALLMLSLFKKM